MGADGHINIVRADEIRYNWPDHEALLKALRYSALGTVYQGQMLGGVEYVTLYWGDNTGDHYRDSAEDTSAVEHSGVTAQRLREFIAWLDTHATHWEVWT